MFYPFFALYSIQESTVSQYRAEQEVVGAHCGLSLVASSPAGFSVRWTVMVMKNRLADTRTHWLLSRFNFKCIAADELSKLHGESTQLHVVTANVSSYEDARKYCQQLYDGTLIDNDDVNLLYSDIDIVRSLKNDVNLFWTNEHVEYTGRRGIRVPQSGHWLRFCDK